MDGQIDKGLKADPSVQRMDGSNGSIIYPTDGGTDGWMDGWMLQVLELLWLVLLDKCQQSPL